jgi:hypothetical protein
MLARIIQFVFRVASPNKYAVYRVIYELGNSFNDVIASCDIALYGLCQHCCAESRRDSNACSLRLQVLPAMPRFPTHAPLDVSAGAGVIQRICEHHGGLVYHLKVIDQFDM